MITTAVEFEAFVLADLERERQLYTLRRDSGCYDTALEAAKLYLNIEYAKKSGKLLSKFYFDCYEAGFNFVKTEPVYWIRVYDSNDYSHEGDGEEYTISMAQLARYMEDRAALDCDLKNAVAQGRAAIENAEKEDEARKMVAKAEAEQKQLQELMRKYPHIAGIAK